MKKTKKEKSKDYKLQGGTNYELELDESDDDNLNNSKNNSGNDYKDNNDFYLSETDDDDDENDLLFNDENIKERDIFVPLEKLFDPIGILDPEGVNNNPITNMPYKNIYYNPCSEKGVKLKYEKYNGEKKYVNDETFENYTYKDIAIMGTKGDGKGWITLPMHKYKEEIINILYKNQVSLLICGTGAGKTVLAPKYALHVLNYKGRIGITNPKQLPNKDNSHFSSQCLDLELGNQISRQYQGSPPHFKPNQNTVLNYMTDGSLINDFNEDPLLKKYDCIIMDEVHERNENIDKLLLLCKELCLKRPKFKLILLSATVDPKIFKNYFDVDNIKYDNFEVQGLKNYTYEEYFINQSPLNELDIKPSIYIDTKNNFKINDQYYKSAFKIIVYILKTYPQNTQTILFFVHTTKTENEIKNLKKELQLHFPDTYERYKIGTVKGGASSSKKERHDQASLLNTKFPNDTHDRCIIFGTEAVESSITINNLGFVIDSGLSIKVYYKYNTDEKIIEKSSIAVSSHKQRAGRVGRTAHGFVFNLFSEETYKKFDDFTVAGIHKNDVSEFIIKNLEPIQEQKITHIEFPFNYNNPTPKSLNDYINKLIEPIEPNNISFLLQKFYALKLFNIKGNYGFLNNLGIAVSKINNPNINNICIKKMVVLSIIYNCFNEISRLVAFLCLPEKNGGLSRLINYSDSDKVKGLDSKKKEDAKIINEIQEKYKKVIKHFYSPYGDFMSILNILNSYFDKKKGVSDPITDRIISEPWFRKDLEEWCKEHFLNKEMLDMLDNSKNNDINREEDDNTASLTFQSIRMNAYSMKLYFKSKYPGLTIQQVLEPYKLIDTKDKTTNLLLTIIDSFFCNIAKHNTISKSDFYYTFLYRKEPELNYLYEIEYKKDNKVNNIKLNDNLFKDDTHLYLWLEEHFKWDKSNVKIMNKEPIYKEENNFTKCNLELAYDRKTNDIKCFYSITKKKDTYLIYSSITNNGNGDGNLGLVTCIPDNIVSILKSCRFDTNLNQRIFEKSLVNPHEKEKKITIKNKKNLKTKTYKKK